MPKSVAPKGFPSPLGLYSHAMIAPPGDLVVVAGQVGTGPSGIAAPDIVAQTRQAFDNVRAVVEAAGCSMRDVVRFQTFLTRADDIPGFMKAREAFYQDHYADGGYPPNTLLVITRLVRPELLVEIEAMAVRSGRRAVARKSGKPTIRVGRVARTTKPARSGSARRRR